MRQSERSSLIGQMSSSMSASNDSVGRPKTDSLLFAFMRSGSAAKASAAKERTLLAVSVLCLIVATVAERLIFKIVVDRMAPYRFVLMQLILMTSVLTYGSIWQLKQAFSGSRITPCMKEFPNSKLLTMAVIDTIQFAGLVVSAAGVQPVLTVLLLHASTPFLTWGSMYAFPERKFTYLQTAGARLIALAVLLSVLGSFLNYFYPGNHQLSDPFSTLIYVAMCALHGISTLYKEKMIIEWSRPVDIHYLSNRLYLYQFAIALALAPVIYLLQGISDGWNAFPLTSFTSNMGDGLNCLLGNDPAGGTSYDSTRTNCSYSYWFVIGYVLCNVVVLECIDRISHTKNQILERALSFAVFMAIIGLAVYDNDFGIDGCKLDSATVIAIFILLVGMEMHGRDPEPDCDAVTAFITS